MFLIHNLKSWGVFLIFFLVLEDVDDASCSANSRGSVCYKVFGLSYFFQLVIPPCWFRVFGVHWGVIWCVLSPWSCISFSTPCIFSEYGCLFMLMFCKLVNLKDVSQLDRITWGVCLPLWTCAQLTAELQVLNAAHGWWVAGQVLCAWMSSIRLGVPCLVSSWCSFWKLFKKNSP